MRGTYTTRWTEDCVKWVRSPSANSWPSSKPGATSDSSKAVKMRNGTSAAPSLSNPGFIRKTCASMTSATYTLSAWSASITNSSKTSSKRKWKCSLTSQVSTPANNCNICFMASTQTFLPNSSTLSRKVSDRQIKRVSWDCIRLCRCSTRFSVPICRGSHTIWRVKRPTIEWTRVQTVLI